MPSGSPSSSPSTAQRLGASSTIWEAKPGSRSAVAASARSECSPAKAPTAIRKRVAPELELLGVFEQRLDRRLADGDTFGGEPLGDDDQGEAQLGLGRCQQPGLGESVLDGSFAPWLYLLGWLQLMAALLLSTISGNIASMGSLSSANRFIVGMVLVAAAVVASLIAGPPESLPGIALGWLLLFHLERGAALAGGVGLIGIVVWRGANGEWPVGFANLVEYAPKKAVEVTAELFAKQEDRVSLLEREHDQRLTALEDKAP